MDEFMAGLEKTRNTQEQMTYFEKLSQTMENDPVSMITKMNAFTLYAPRQTITAFLEKYEIYKLAKNVPGSIVECGVAAGMGLMAFAHFCSIFEPYHYVRKIIGFDTFEGFVGVADQDRTTKAEHVKKGGLKFESYERLQKVAELYDMNRALGHLKKVELVKGDISKTFKKYLEDNPGLVISLLFMDVDLYKPTLDTLKLAIDRVPKGGVIAFDQLNHGDYPGETIAVMEAIGINNLRLQRSDFSSKLCYAIVE